MMSSVENREMRNIDMDALNAALTAIASDESPTTPPSDLPKRRWTSLLRKYWCFGRQKSSRHFRRAVLVPVSNLSMNGAFIASPENATQQSNHHPSPASFRPSDSPSASQSSAASEGLNSVPPNTCSPIRPRSIFAIGPYAHETQLVTPPPAFSSFTTQPSTAPFTPPRESLLLTNPSSPEVSFAQLLDRSNPPQFDFRSYHLHPESPVAPFISPGSTFSGSGQSSPFPNPHFPDIRKQFPQNFLSDMGHMRDWDSQQASGSATPDSPQLKSRDQHDPDKPSNSSNWWAPMRR